MTGTTKKLKRIFLLPAASIVMLFLFSSCSTKPEFEQYHKFDNNTWNRFNFVNFEFPVTNTGQEYDVFVCFRYLPQYPEKKINFVLTIYTPSGEMRSSEHKLWLINEDGKLKGENKGDFIEVKIPVREEISFSETGIAKFEIENKMTKLNTPGIYEIGLIVEKSKEEEKDI